MKVMSRMEVSEIGVNNANIKNNYIKCPNKIELMSIYFLIIWFAITLEPYVSIYTDDLSIVIIRTIKSIIDLNKSILAVLSVVILNIEQFISLFVAGFVAGLLFHGRHKKIVCAFIISLCHALPSIIILFDVFKHSQIDDAVFIISRLAIWGMTFISTFLGLSIVEMVMNLKSHIEVGGGHT